MNRRVFLAGIVGAGVTAGIAGCSPRRQDDTGAPRPGGTLRIGALGQASAVVSDPFGLLGNDSDMLIMSLVYDPLTVPGKSPNVVPRLAKSWTSDSTQTNWTFDLADNAALHDGSPVRPQDVAWSPRTLGERTAWKVPVDLASIQPAGRNAVTMRTASPNSQLPLLMRLMTFTVKEGAQDRSNFLGSGPFRVQPGTYRDGNVTLVRNDAWHGGRPLLDRIEITGFGSTDALSHAILGGQIDVASNVGALAARAAAARPDLAVVRRPNDLSMPVAMRTSDGPYADPRVREAIRLGVDREAMVDQVLSGYGSVVILTMLLAAEPAQSAAVQRGDGRAEHTDLSGHDRVVARVLDVGQQGDRSRPYRPGPAYRIYCVHPRRDDDGSCRGAVCGRAGMGTPAFP